MNWKKFWNIIDDSSKKGGQGEVFKVQNKNQNEIFGALKIMHESQVKSSKRKSRFENEIDALKKIDNKNIPKVLEFEIENTNPYFITEWIEGEDLSEYVAKNNFSINEALHFSRKLALIVDSCHQNDIIHRDIKPQNIRVKNEQPILIDFGICWTFDEEKNKSGKTPVGEELGNRFLRLPELTAGSKEKHEKNCDVTFIVGILFYLITKRYPRQLKDSDDKMPQERLSEEEIKKYQKDKHWIKTNRIFNVGFQQSSKLRFESCIELINAIDTALNIEEEMSNEDELDEIKQQLSELINTDELKQKRNAVEKFKTLNDKLYKEVINEVTANGTSVSNNENSSATSHRKNMYIKNNMFPNIQTIISHQIEIIDNKINCSYTIKENQLSEEFPVSYYKGYISDLETLEEAINENRNKMIREGIENYKNQLK